MQDLNEKMNNDLTKRIMRRAYVIWAIRMLLHPLFLKSLIVLLLVMRSTKYISYEHVFANAPAITDIPQIFVFLRGAFAHTEGMTLALLLGVMAVSAWLVSDFLRRRQHSYF